MILVFVLRSCSGRRTRRGSVTWFCAEQGISRKTFHEIRKRVAMDGPAALAPRSRRPSSSPNRIVDEVAERAVAVRAALEQSGLDHGPIGVREKMCSLGMDPVPRRYAEGARPIRSR